jgi:hypothetical protein
MSMVSPSMTVARPVRVSAAAEMLGSSSAAREQSSCRTHCRVSPLCGLHGSSIAFAIRLRTPQPSRSTLSRPQDPARDRGFAHPKR